MKDTVYYSDNGNTITSLIRRENVYAGQAPELFRLKPYIQANESLMPDDIMNINGSSEPAVMAGMDIVMIPGMRVIIRLQQSLIMTGLSRG